MGVGADVAVLVTLYIRVANMAVPIENINRPLGSVCCDGEFAIALLYESIACSVMMAKGFVIAVRMYINPSALYLYHLLWYSLFFVLADAFFEQFGDFGL